MTTLHDVGWPSWFSDNAREACVYVCSRQRVHVNQVLSEECPREESTTEGPHGIAFMGACGWCGRTTASALHLC